MALPKCYGVFWEAIPSIPDCYEKCTDKEGCLAKFATATLPKYQRELGEENATPQALSEVTGISTEAIVIALQYQKDKGFPAAKSVEREPVHAKEPVQDPGVSIPPPVAESVSQVSAPPPMPSSPVSIPPPIDGQELADASGIDVNKPLVVPPGEALSDSNPGQEPNKKAAPRKKKAASTKKKKPKNKTESTKKPTKKKAPPRKKKAAPVNPQGAGAAKHAAAPVSMSKTTSAQHAGGSGREWSPEYDGIRFNREREKNPLIRNLLPGYTLMREYPAKSGQEYKIQVHKDHYTCQGQRFPTLQAVTDAITGVKEYPCQLLPDGSRPEGVRKMSNWSAVRFFGLDKIMLSKAERKGVVLRPKVKRRGRPRKE